MDHARPGAWRLRHRSDGVLPLNASADAGALPAGKPRTYEELLQELRDSIPKDASSAVLLADLPALPALHARLGFEASEAWLQSLADCFSVALGERGEVRRLGQGCYCVHVRNIRNAGHAVLAAEKLLRAAEEMIESSAGSTRQELNIGISLYPLHGTDPGTLIRKAQLAAAAARRRAARQVLFDEDCAAQVLEPWALGEAYAEALSSGGLQVFYQPKIRIADGRPAGVEALMRWLRDGAPVASPDVFIPLAENAGLIHDTTWYALSNSLRLSADCQGLPIAVNITPAMLHHREFVDMVRTAMSTWSVKPRALTLEVTEGALIADLAQANARLLQLRELGVRISIDDFGTGYSSLSYFKKIPADEIKIDKSFVMRMCTDKADQRLVETIVGLAHQFGLEVVAEGVEDARALALLSAIGCHYGQGYFFSPALDAQQLQTWMRDQPQQA